MVDSGGMDEVNVFGGAGDDQLLPKDPTADAMGSNKARLYGGEGNDLLEGIRGVEGTEMFGGPGDDKMILAFGTETTA